MWLQPRKIQDSRGRWDRNRTCTLRFWRPNPACRVVSGSVAMCRCAPLSLSPDVVKCRRVSSVSGANSGAADASAGALFPALPLPAAHTNGGIETLYYCADCHIRAMVEIVEESNP